MSEVRKPCLSCPWRVDAHAQDIPNFSLDLAENLTHTCDGELTSPIFACHQSRIGEEIVCAGWLARYGWDSIPIRLRMVRGEMGPEGLDPGEDWPELHKTFEEMITKLREDHAVDMTTTETTNGLSFVVDLSDYSESLAAEVSNGIGVVSGKSVWYEVPEVENRDKVAFTIGRLESYDKYLRDDSNPGKRGRHPGYEGGWVWRTAREAFEFLDDECMPEQGYAVYELALPSGWSEDVSPDRGVDGVHHLWSSADIIGRVND